MTAATVGPSFTFSMIVFVGLSQDYLMTIMSLQMFSVTQNYQYQSAKRHFGYLDMFLKTS